MLLIPDLGRCPEIDPRAIQLPDGPARGIQDIVRQLSSPKYGPENTGETPMIPWALGLGLGGAPDARVPQTGLDGPMSERKAS